MTKALLRMNIRGGCMYILEELGVCEGYFSFEKKIMIDTNDV